jgi:TPR repeat protein
MRYETAALDGATLAPVNATGEAFFELGMMYAAGRSVAPDLVLAHKWFNLAAMRGNGEATRLRREIAEEMSAAEIAAAQRAARDWLTTH